MTTTDPTPRTRPIPEPLHDTPLARARYAAGLTQQDVADRWNAEHPHHPTTARSVGRWEAGQHPPGRLTLRRLAAILAVRPADLITEDGEPAEYVRVTVSVLRRRPGQSRRNSSSHVALGLTRNQITLAVCDALEEVLRDCGATADGAGSLDVPRQGPRSVS